MIRAAALALALALAGPAAAHDRAASAAAPAAGVAADTGAGFLAGIGGPFALTDQTGARRTEADPQGRMQLLFFGYANCRSICPVALPLMAEATRALDAGGLAVTPVMVTVDPARDTVRTIGPPLAAQHPRFVGLTGTEAELARARDAFQVEHSVVFEDPEYGPVFAHGSHIYVLDAQGGVLTLLPPILGAARLAQIVRGYAGR
ncbi:SCO family protein [Halovulum marinum]|uniref:SCO family protein n=1 Tax=Halovulum marinum TaxID=2662447 RepID=UPI002D79BFCF|nr:SCO family protein [Halovulum marinum]